MRHLRYALLGVLALAAMLINGERAGAIHVADIWQHEVTDGGVKTVPGASFWGFVSTVSSEDFLGPFNQARQDQLDPVNVIFFTSGSSPALDVAASALQNSGWTRDNPCLVAAPLYAYFDGAPLGNLQDLHLFKAIHGCNEKFHIRLFQPVDNSSWVIGAAHHECNNLLNLNPECPDTFDTVISDGDGGWEDAEDLVRTNVMASGLVRDNWNADLENPDNGPWRGAIPNDGIAEVFELTCPPSGTIVRVSVDSVCGQANANSFDPSAMSADGRFVAFWSIASNLVDDDTLGLTDVFMHNRQLGQTSRTSLASDGCAARGHSSRPSISADGRFVAFESNARNLVGPNTDCSCPLIQCDGANQQVDVFVRDRVTGVTTRVSVATDGTEADNPSGASSISADGRYVAFQSDASNLVPGDTNGRPDIFVHDREMGETTRVSLPSPSCPSCGSEATGFSTAPNISADGRFVVFESDAILISGMTTPSRREIYVRDTCAGAGTACTPDTIRVSVPDPSCSACGSEADSPSASPSISADGRHVAFTSDASNLVTGDTNLNFDTFVHDRQTATTERVSVDSAGNEGSGSSISPSISGNGRFVVFESNSMLVPDKTTGLVDAFVHDRVTGQTMRVSVALNGEESNFHIGGVSINGDGRYVAFTSSADNLVGGDTNGTRDVFVRDLGDADGDGEWDSFDPCPASPDCDGDSLGLGDVFGLFFRDGVEVFIGTLPLVACAATPAINDEDPDALGPDWDDSQDVDGSDVFLFAQRFGAELGVPPPLPPKQPYSVRFDIYPTSASRNKIDGSDVFVLAKYFGKSCA